MLNKNKLRSMFISTLLLCVYASFSVYLPHYFEELYKQKPPIEKSINLVNAAKTKIQSESMKDKELLIIALDAQIESMMSDHEFYLALLSALKSFSYVLIWLLAAQLISLINIAKWLRKMEI
jgi:hypothetical protein